MSSQAAIQNWITYWCNAKMVALDEIRAFEHVYQARKYCQCMRVGKFHPELISDLQIWNAIRALRLTKAA